jgi:hypothetical protein
VRKFKIHRIVRVVPLPPLNLIVQFDDGRVVMADLSGVAERGGIFERLRDDSYFKRAKTTNGGRAVAWPNGLDFCADALYVTQVRSRRAKPTTNVFGAHIFTPTTVVTAA